MNYCKYLELQKNFFQVTKPETSTEETTKVEDTPKIGPLEKLKELVPEVNDDCFIFFDSMKANNTKYIGCTLKLQNKSFFGEGDLLFEF